MCSFLGMYVQVTWLPFGADPATAVRRTIFTGWVRYRDIIEPYMPGRSVRQLGFVQTIPHPISRPRKAMRPWKSALYRVEHSVVNAADAWIQFPQTHILQINQNMASTDDPAACDAQYIEWYYRHSHPRLLNTDDPDAEVIPSRGNSEYVSFFVILLI